MTAQSSASNLLNRFGSVFQDISTGTVNPGQVWILDMFAFGPYNSCRVSWIAQLIELVDMQAWVDSFLY